MIFCELQYKGFLGILAEKGSIPLWLWFGGIGICLLIGYFLGSINTAIVVSKLKYKQDIRSFGSGNAGMTNMLRTYGKGAAGMTLAGDILKTVIAILIAELVAGGYGAYFAGFGCVIGHCFPIYYNFKGGKGVLATAAMVLMLKPGVFLVLITVFIIIVAFTKYVSLGSVISALMYPVLLSSFAKEPFEQFGCIFAVIIAFLVVFMHRANIKRLREGKENKISLKKKKSNEDNSEGK